MITPHILGIFKDDGNLKWTEWTNCDSRGNEKKKLKETYQITKRRRVVRIHSFVNKSEIFPLRIYERKMN